MTKRAAVIDLGTNTWNLAIAEQTEEQLNWLFSHKVPVKLAEGALEEQRITTDAKQRALNAIKEHLEHLKTYEVPLSHTIAYGTSGMRSFSNGASLAEEIEQEYGIQINIIAGDEEASLIKKGISQAIKLPSDHPYLLMDIGGGSTEFILGIGHKTLWQTSTQLGVSRLKERYQPNDPMAPIDVDMLRFHFGDELAELREQLALYPPKVLIGSSGSFESLATIHHKKQQSTDSLPTNYVLQQGEANSILQKLIVSNYQDRLDWPGLPVMRAETMQIAALLIDHILTLTATKELHISFYAMKEGAMLSWLSQIRA